MRSGLGVAQALPAPVLVGVRVPPVEWVKEALLVGGKLRITDAVLKDVREVLPLWLALPVELLLTAGVPLSGGL